MCSWFCFACFWADRLLPYELSLFEVVLSSMETLLPNLSKMENNRGKSESITWMLIFLRQWILILMETQIQNLGGNICWNMSYENVNIDYKEDRLGRRYVGSLTQVLNARRPQKRIYTYTHIRLNISVCIYSCGTYRITLTDNELDNKILWPRDVHRKGGPYPLRQYTRKFFSSLSPRSLTFRQKRMSNCHPSEPSFFFFCCRFFPRDIEFSSHSPWVACVTSGECVRVYSLVVLSYLYSCSNF